MRMAVVLGFWNITLYSMGVMQKWKFLFRITLYSMGSIYANRIVRDNTVQYWFVSMWNPLLKAIINNIAFFSLLHSSHVHIAPTPSIIVLPHLVNRNTHKVQKLFSRKQKQNKTQTCQRKCPFIPIPSPIAHSGWRIGSLFNFLLGKSRTASSVGHFYPPPGVHADGDRSSLH